ncbi:MAG: rhomboid family intramembrane serine protease [Candidatus Aminicenantes bacterium]|jgi:membrane associated rhomboid family serine protease
MLIPIGHESSTVRRLPWITFAIMAICLVVHILVTLDLDKREKDLENAAREFLGYYVEHPYLELDPETLNLVFGERLAEQVQEQLDIIREEASREIHLFQETQQEELNQLAENLKNIITNIPYRKYGFIPAQQSFLALLTYMFIHGGWFHLLGNLLFLYLTGPFIEDVWGRPIYTAFYLIMGIGSALMFAQHYPNFSGPLIGASGAIAGVMGAFLIRYWKTKIEFFYIFLPFFFIRGTFKAPAWLMLPLWFALEFFNARVMDSINPQGGGGVAHWAHVWGFVFGVVAAIGVKYFRIEEKYVQPKIEAQTSYEDEGFKALEEAEQMKEAGKLDAAYARLVEAARRNRMHKELIEGLWELGAEMGKESETARFLVALIESEVRRNQLEMAAVHFWKLRERIPQATISPTYKVMLIRHLKDRNEVEDARALASELLDEVSADSPPVLLINFANVALELSPAIAERVTAFCLQHPEIQEQQKETLKAKLGEPQKIAPVVDPSSSGEPEAPKDERQPAAEPEESAQIPTAVRSIKATRATPLRINEEKLALNMEGAGERVLTLDRIQAVAAAEITSLDDLPYLVIDLFLDDPKSEAATVRSIRLISSSFEPREFFPDIQDSREALKAFISHLLESSGGAAYPDKESALLSPPRSFHSIEEYEALILS